MTKRLPSIALAGCLILGAAITVATAGPAAAKSGANIKVKVYNVLPLDGSEIRVYMDWTNKGGTAGSASCVINTTVHNQFGDVVNIHTNSTGTNGNVKPHRSQRLYQDLGVDKNDAAYVKIKNVKVVDC